MSCNCKFLTLSVINWCKKLIAKLAKEQRQPHPDGTYEVNIISENVITNKLMSEAI